MVLFTWREILDIIIMTLAIGFIFKDLFRYKPKVEIITPEYYIRSKNLLHNPDFWFAMSVVAPSIILHEFGHKFVAIANGMSATFEASYLWLGIGVILHIIGLGLIFIVPAYTSIIGSFTPLQSAAISFAGPAVNLILWTCAVITLKNIKRLHLKQGTIHFLAMIRKINMWLFIFNMLPIPMFDGFSVYTGLFHALFG